MLVGYSEKGLNYRVWLVARRQLQEKSSSREQKYYPSPTNRRYKRRQLYHRVVSLWASFRGCRNRISSLALYRDFVSLSAISFFQHMSRRMSTIKSQTLGKRRLRFAIFGKELQMYMYHIPLMHDRVKLYQLYECRSSILEHCAMHLNTLTR